MKTTLNYNWGTGRYISLRIEAENDAERVMLDDMRDQHIEPEFVPRPVGNTWPYFEFKFNLRKVKP